jgi:ribosomal protein L37AE/L43A
MCPQCGKNRVIQIDSKELGVYVKCRSCKLILHKGTYQDFIEKERKENAAGRIEKRTH